ncbi:MAG: hypothetical protein QXP98_08095 [Thermoproteus sp.]
MPLEAQGKREVLEALREALREGLGVESTLVCNSDDDCRLWVFEPDAHKLNLLDERLAEAAYGEKIFDDGRLKIFIRALDKRRVEVTIAKEAEGEPWVYQDVYRIGTKARGIRWTCRRGKCRLRIGDDYLLALVAQSRKASEAVFGVVVYEEEDFRVHIDEDLKPTFVMRRGGAWRPLLAEREGDRFVVYGDREDLEELRRRLERMGIGLDPP